MRTLLWIIAGMGAVLGGGLLVLGVLMSNSAPQQAAVAAIACAAAVLPYVLARAWDELSRPTGRPTTEPKLPRPLRERDRRRVLRAAAITGALALIGATCLFVSQWALGSEQYVLTRGLGDAATVFGVAFGLALLATFGLAVAAHRRA